jgi:hypothetical protein
MHEVIIEFHQGSSWRRNDYEDETRRKEEAKKELFEKKKMFITYQVRKRIYFYF